jgi:hypothetical protein
MRKLLTLLAVLVVPSLAHAQAGVQWTLERDATLVSKDVGSERWAITYRLSDGRTTGNVFRADGGPPAFLDCERTSVDEVNATFDCFGADACPEAPCPSSQYVLIESGIVLPLSFFFPPGDTPGTGSPTVEDLIGTWRFVIDPGDDQSERTYRFDRVEEEDGQLRAVGEAEGSGNDVVAFASEGGFILFDEGTVRCDKYEFTFANLDRLEGTRFETLFLPVIGGCDDDPDTTIESDPFFAERIG